MLKSVVTDAGKNRVTEVVHLSHKSSELHFILKVFTYKLMEKLIDIMEEDDDVQNIWHNWEE